MSTPAIEKQNPTPSPGLSSEEIISQNYSALSGAVDQKAYSRPPHSFTPQELSMDIPEPGITPPPQTNNAAPSAGAGASSDKGEKAQTRPAYNPDLNDLPESQRKKNAEQMASYLLQLYAQGKVKANDLVKISQRRINKLANSGEIDMNVMVQVGEDQQMSLAEFFRFYNDQCDGQFKMTQEFHDAVHPVLTRVLAKHGHGMTDEQFLIFMFGQDIFTMVAEGMATRALLKDMINFAKEHSAKSGKFATPPPPPPPPPPAQPVTTDYTENDIPPPPVMPIEPPKTLQQQAVDSVHFVPAGSKRQQPLPVYGDPKKLNKLENFDAVTKAAEKRGQSNAKKILAASKEKNRIGIVDVPTGVKKRGRKPGQKNKPKLK